MYQESEIVDLLMVLFLTPIMWVTFRSLRAPSKRWFLVGYVAMISAYTFTVAEGYAAPDVFNMLEHLAYGVAGCGFALGSWMLLVGVRGESGR